MHEEPADELDCGERHPFLFVAIRVVAVAERDFTIRAIQQSVV